MKVKNYTSQKYSLTFLLNTLREDVFLTDSGKLFHCLGTEEQNEPSNIAVFDLGAAREPFVDDCSVRLSDCDIHVVLRRTDIWIGVRLMRAL